MIEIPKKETKIKQITQSLTQIPSNNNELNRSLKDFLKEIKKTTQSLVQFNTGNTNDTNYLNFRNNLFTKDIEKRLLVIDTKNMINHTNTSDFKIDFVNGSKNNANGYGPIHNVIGFRLVKALLSHISYQVHDGNNKLVIKLASGITEIILTNGSYTPTTLASELKTKLVADSGILTATVTFSSTTNKYTITLNVAFALHLSQTDSSMWRLLGFDNRNHVDSELNTTHISDNPIDHSHHFIDLVIDEIPSIACKMHPSGYKLIDRIPLSLQSGALIYYMAPVTEFSSINYFYPITLKQLSIKLYEDTHDRLYQSQSLDHSFEFELTILKNTKLMN